MPADVETSSDAYAQRFEGPVGRWFLDVQQAAVRDLISPLSAARVLDVGGGHGQLAGPLADDGRAVAVVGSSLPCAHRLRALLAAGRVRFVVSDLLALAVRDRAAGVALAFRLLPHVADWPQLLRELCRVAARAVVVDYPTTRSVNAAAGPLFGAKRRVEGDTRPFRVFADGEVEAAFEANGFRVTGRRPQFALPMALHRALRAASLSRALEAGLRASGVTARLGSPVVLRAERVG